jgi:hypothetical protein
LRHENHHSSRAGIGSAMCHFRPAGSAADDPGSANPPPLPPPVFAPIYSWTGVYVGINAGYGGLYLTGGGMYAVRNVTIPTASSVSVQRTGFVGGAGVEGLITPKITLRAEYLYMQTFDDTSTISGAQVTSHVSDNMCGHQLQARPLAAVVPNVWLAPGLQVDSCEVVSSKSAAPLSIPKIPSGLGVASQIPRSISASKKKLAIRGNHSKSNSKGQKPAIQ